MRTQLTGLLFALLLGNAHAHQLWLEPEGKNVVLHFGEYNENLKETSPGLLDRVPMPAVAIFEGGNAKPVNASKGKDGFVLGSPADGSRHLTAEVRSYPVREVKQGDTAIRSKWIAAARYAPDFSAQAAHNLLDIVPDGAIGKFRLFFHGHPLAKAKVDMIAPNGWQKEATTDADGRFELQPLWQGVYVLEVSHKDTSAGEIDGEAYDTATFTSTLTIVNPAGPPTARPAAAVPHQLK